MTPRIPDAQSLSDAEQHFDEIWARELEGLQYWIARVRKLVSSALQGGNPDASRAELLHLADLGRGLDADLNRMLAWGVLPCSRTLLSQSTFVLSWAGTLLQREKDALLEAYGDPGLPEEALEAADILSDVVVPARELSRRLSSALRASDGDIS